MTLGEKLKSARRKLKITQADLCGEKITRNMLSCIENNKAMPSLDTLAYLSARLELPISYIVSDDDDTFFYQKRTEMRYITAAFKAQKFKECIDHIEKIEGRDDELYFLLATCHFEIGKNALMHGSLKTASFHLNKVRDYSLQTMYDTHRITNYLPLYLALSANIQSPLLELDTEMFEPDEELIYESEFYSYVSNETGRNYTVVDFKRHMLAKGMMRNRDYFSAIRIMKEIEDEKTAKTYNACVIFGIYTDMENCYRQLGDFENAYRYSSKRISMIEGFKS